MWTPQIVSLQDALPALLAALRELQRVLRRTASAHRLKRAAGRLKETVSGLPSHLVRFSDASDDVKAQFRDGYLATLEVAQLLDQLEEDGIGELDERLVHASFLVFDYLEDWRPFICNEDTALQFVMLDGIDLGQALALVGYEDPVGTDVDPEDDCPLSEPSGVGG